MTHQVHKQALRSTPGGTGAFQQTAAPGNDGIQAIDLMSHMCPGGMLSEEQQHLSSLLMADWISMHSQEPWVHAGLLPLAHQVRPHAQMHIL